MKYLTVFALLGLTQSIQLAYRPATTHQDVVNDEQLQADEDIHQSDMKKADAPSEAKSGERYQTEKEVTEVVQNQINEEGMSEQKEMLKTIEEAEKETGSKLKLSGDKLAKVVPEAMESNQAESIRLAENPIKYDKDWNHSKDVQNSQPATEQKKDKK